MIRTHIFPDSVNTPNGTRQIRFLESAGTVNAGTKDPISPRPLSATVSSSRQQPFTVAASSTTGHRDWQPGVTPTPEHDSQMQKKKSLESFREILRHVQTLRSLIAPENWLEAADSIGSTSNMADLGAPQVTLLSDTRGPRRVSMIILIFVACALIYYLFLRQSIRSAR